MTVGPPARSRPPRPHPAFQSRLAPTPHRSGFGQDAVRDLRAIALPFLSFLSFSCGLCGVVSIRFNNATSSRIAVVQQLLGRLPSGDPFKASCMPILTTTIALTSRRNSLTHHLWAVDEATGNAYTFDYRQPPDTQARKERRTANSILLFVNEIMSNCREYEVLLGQRPPTEPF